MGDEDGSRYCPVLVATLLWRLSELSVAYSALICTAQAPRLVGTNRNNENEDLPVLVPSGFKRFISAQHKLLTIQHLNE